MRSAVLPDATDTVLRVLVPADADQFRTLRQRSLIDHPDAYHSTAEEWGTAIETYVRRIEENCIIGMFVDDALAGAVILNATARGRAKMKHKCEFWSVYVAPEHRGGGRGRRLLQHTIEEARRRGFEAVVLSVTVQNPARKLYEELGFVAYGVEPRALKLPDGTYIDDCLMQLDLT
jgi:ribosomal protein S18 acetylase RimI-like enzyme